MHHPKRCVLVPALVLTLTSMAAVAQNCDQWQAVFPTPGQSPGARSGHAMASDPWRGGVVLFGGTASNTADSLKTMLWDGLTWTIEATGGAGQPGPRMHHGMVYDPVRGKVVLFGGRALVGNAPTGNGLGDTWEWTSGTWNGSSWSAGSWAQISPGVSPSGRFGHSMAWDAKNQRVLLFGGTLTGATAIREQWSYDGTTWTQSTLPLGALPPGRFHAPIAGDSLHQTVVLAAGLDPGVRTDTWEWDGSDWTQIGATPSMGGGIRGNWMTFDHNAGRPLLVVASGVAAGTYALGNGAWTIYPTGGQPAFPGGSFPAMAFDHVSSRTAGYGGPTSSSLLFLWESCCEDGQIAADANGNPIYPPDVDPATQNDDPNINLDLGLVTNAFPGTVTDLDNWHATLPCNPSIGGQVPPGVNPPYLSDPYNYQFANPNDPISGLELDSSTPGGDLAAMAALYAGLAGVQAQTISTQLDTYEQAIAQLVDQVIPPLKNNPGSLAPVTGNYTAPPPRCINASDDYVFGGQDIVFIHGLRMDPLFDALVGTPNGPIATAGWTLPSTVPGTGNNPEFYGTGYWKAGAEAYWQYHIKRFLTDKNKKNRYLVVAWPSTQRMEVGVQAILTQIGDAMRSGIGVVDPLNPNGPPPTDFGTPGFVIVSHSTGGPISDVAMERAPLIAGGQATFIQDHCSAHVALHCAFEGSRMATAVVALALYGYNNVPTWVCPLAQFGVWALNQTTNINTYPISCSFNFPAAWNSVLVDLVPSVMKTRWGPSMNATPMPVLTVGGGHPSYLAPFKYLLHLGFDDGVVNMNSQFANPDSVTIGPIHLPSNPSGYRPSPFGILQSAVFDMGVARTDPLRALGLYLDQVQDNWLNLLFNVQHPFGVASSPVAWLSPTGMNQPVGKVFNPIFDPRSYRPRHYSLLLSTADHFSDLGSTRYDQPDENGWPAAATNRRDNYRPTFGEVNCEEVSVRRNPELYLPHANVAFPLLAQPLVNGPPPVKQFRRGRQITFKRINRWLPAAWRIPPVWIWRRDYTLLDQYKDKVECDYVYEWVLTQRLFDCPPGQASVSSFGQGCFGSNNLRPTLAATGLPRFGLSMQVNLRDAQPNDIAVLAIGLNNAYWFAANVPLPFDLGPAGAPGCPLLISPDVTMLFLTDGAGGATFNQGIPANPAFLGLSVYYQGFGHDVAANALGLVTSNGLVGVVGP